MKFVSLAQHGESQLQQALVQLSKDHGFTNVFNPSLSLAGGTWHLAFRAESFTGEKPFRAFYTHLVDGRFSDPLDLTDFLRERGLAQVADPKLVKLDDELFFTFNTGNLGKVNNTIFLMRIWPTMGSPQKCEVSDRQTVEKNWAFFKRDGNLCALYSLSPVVQLKLASGLLGSEDVLFFERAGNVDDSGTISQSISIGSQLSFASPEMAYMVVHDKPRFLGKRGYIGRLAQVQFDQEGGISVRVAQTRLIHSILKMLHFGKRHNPNILWAFYFSGLVAEGDNLTLSFGVNDLEFFFSQLKLDQIWP
ncbi:hypothetical protein [Pseudorhodoferax sp. Leaf265]|uniref:hypothetical protein n=1 Tax=Pseudorhodoferax sp. Leaf265 TaxID=1736315 RepID=UPI0006FD6114|nr:hypothetical protein [Pseudorhodoferax sp. Leaf265]KQP21178.1 hypothetical protein ASF45_03055 [Pseudorhodoferax sp. Leaf265]